MGRKQYDLNDGRNAWILKPGGKSRGRGIEIHDNLKDLFNTINGSKDTIWITQKYIERPMVVIGKKFDIRVWVLVTSVNPLTVFMFTKPYLRFTSEDYDPTKLSDKFMHLTNASISKNNYNAKKIKTEGKYEIVDNMWHT
jgi:tubulin monoglycylase TTLL3/8